MKTSLVLLFASQLGCAASESAVEECEALGVALCDSVRDCALNAGSTVEQCRAHFASSVACQDAARVSSTYDQCMADLENRVCPQNPFLLLDPTIGLPLACVGAIELK